MNREIETVPGSRPALGDVSGPAPRPEGGAPDGTPASRGRAPALAPLSIPIRPLRLGGERNGLSVDLEDWYHICNVEEYLPSSRWDEYEERVTRNTHKILDLLEKSGVRATFFILGYIAERHPGIVKDVVRGGHEVATHGYFHQRVFQMTPDAFREDLVRSMEAISAVAGRPVVGYRAPMWSINRNTLWAIEILREEGILYDSSVAPFTVLSGRDLPTLPFQWETSGGPVREFPLSTVRCFWENLPYSGGLPMRMMPHWYVVRLIRRTNQAGSPGLVYIHPWEFDQAVLRLEIPFWSRFFQNFNLAATPPRVEELLRHFEFAPLGEVLMV